MDIVLSIGQMLRTSIWTKKRQLQVKMASNDPINKHAHANTLQISKLWGVVINVGGILFHALRHPQVNAADLITVT